RAAHHVVGPVEALALVAIDHDLHCTGFALWCTGFALWCTGFALWCTGFAVGRHAGQAAVAALAHDEPALQIERGPVALAGLAADHFHWLAGRHAVERARADVDEVVEAVGMPR